MRPEQSAIKELFRCLKCSALMAILNVGAWVIWTRPQICRNAADKEPYGRLIKWFCLETAVTLTRSLWDAFTNQLWLRIGFNSPCRWLNLCYLSLSLSPRRRWAIAHHMASSEQFVCAICSQLAIETFCSVVTRQCERDSVPAPLTPRFRVPKRAQRVPNVRTDAVNCHEVVCQIKGSASIPGEKRHY